MTTKVRGGLGGYKKHLLEVRKQMASGRASVYDVAQRLVTVFNDLEFRGDIGAADDFDAAEALSLEVADLCVDFLELKAMLEEFPTQQTWEDTPLAKLYQQAREKIAARADAEPRPERKSTRVKLADFEMLKAEKQDVQAQLNYAQRQIKDSGGRLTELEEENRKLRMENERLKGRLEEMERVMRREFAAA